VVLAGHGDAARLEVGRALCAAVTVDVRGTDPVAALQAAGQGEPFDV